MKKVTVFLRLGWSGLFLYSFMGLIHSPSAVAWLLAALSSVVPLSMSAVLNAPKWDRTFLSIAAVSLNGVALAVCLGQWAVLDASPASLGLVPFSSLILWFVHERLNRQKKP